MRNLYKRVGAACVALLCAMLLWVPTAQAATGTITFDVKNDQGAAVEGVIFELRTLRAHVGTATSTAGGTVVFADLVPGTYAISLQGVPQGSLYTVPTGTVVVATVADDGTVTYDRPPAEAFTLTKPGTQTKGTITFVVRNDQDTAVEGVTFALYSSLSQVGTATSTSNGTVTFKDLLPGMYAIFLQGLPPNSTYTVPTGTMVFATIAADGKVTYDRNPADAFKLSSSLKATTFRITDVHGNPVPGATFHIAGGTVRDNFTTDDTGDLVLELPAGSYTMTNVYAPMGWGVSNASMTFTVDPSGNYIYTRSPSDVFKLTMEKFTLTFTKLDDAEEPVEGATFRLTGTALNTTATSNKAGVVTFKDLQAKDPAIPKSGEYVLSESSAPSGYTRKEGNIRVEVAPDGTVSFPGGEEPGAFFVNPRTTYEFSFVYRDDAGTPLSGAEFELKGDAGTFTAVSEGITGRVHFKDLPFDDYRLTQTSAEGGYAPSDESVDVVVSSSGGVNTSRDPATVFQAQRQRFGFSFTAQDEEGEDMAGAVYTLTGGEGGAKTAKSLADGEVAFADLLPGKYLLSQTSVPAGKTRSTETVTVTVAKDGTVTFSTPIETTIIPGVAKFTVSFDKVDDLGEPVAGATFSLQGTGYAEEARSNGEGNVTFSDLLPGTYTLRETVAPEGYAISTGTVTVTVGDAGQVTYSAQPGTVFTNPRASYALSFVTVDEQGEPMSGARFAISGANGLRMEANSGRRGVVNFTRLPHGTYSIEQLSAPTGFVKSPRKLSAVIAPGGTKTYYAIENGETDSVALETADGYFVNTTGPVSFAFAALNDIFLPLERAAFRLTENVTGKEATAVSSFTGYATFYGVMPGDYTLRQVNAPPDYLPSEDEYTLRIDAGGQMTVYEKTLPPPPVGGGATAAPAEPVSTVVFEGMMPLGEVEVLPPISFVSERAKAPLEVRLRDAVTGEGILGASFTLHQEVDSPSVGVVVTDAEGNARTASLLPDVYYLKAQTVPVGYEILTDGGAIRAEVPATGQAVVEVLAQPIAQGVVARPEGLIAQVGGFIQDNAIALAVSGAGALLLGAFLVVALKRK